jgi:hypothetical protein
MSGRRQSVPGEIVAGAAPALLQDIAHRRHAFAASRLHAQSAVNGSYRAMRLSGRANLPVSESIAKAHVHSRNPNHRSVQTLPQISPSCN